MKETMQWRGNITIRLGKHEDTYPPGVITVEKYYGNYYMIRIEQSKGEYSIILRLNKDELQKLLAIIAQILTI